MLRRTVGLLRPFHSPGSRANSGMEVRSHHHDGPGTPRRHEQAWPPRHRKQDGEKKYKKFEPAAPPSRIGRKQRKQEGPEAPARLRVVTLVTKCKLRLSKMERIKDYVFMEEEFAISPEHLKPKEDKNEEDRSKVDDLRESPMSVGDVEELINENHAIVSSSVGVESYISVLSFVDKDQLEPGCAIILHNKVLSVVGIHQDEVDSFRSVMKVDKAPLESYADPMVWMLKFRRSKKQLRFLLHVLSCMKMLV